MSEKYVVFEDFEALHPTFESKKEAFDYARSKSEEVKQLILRDNPDADVRIDDYNASYDDDDLVISVGARFPWRTYERDDDTDDFFKVVVVPACMADDEDQLLSVLWRRTERFGESGTEKE